MQKKSLKGNALRLLVPNVLSFFEISLEVEHFFALTIGLILTLGREDLDPRTSFPS